MEAAPILAGSFSILALINLFELKQLMSMKEQVASQKGQIKALSNQVTKQ